MSKKTIIQQAKEAVNRVDLYAENLTDVIWVFAPDDIDKVAPVSRRPVETLKTEAGRLRDLGKQLTWLMHQLVAHEQAILASDAAIAGGSATQLSSLGALVPELTEVRALIKDVKSSKNLAFDMAVDIDGFATRN